MDIIEKTIGTKDGEDVREGKPFLSVGRSVKGYRCC